MHSREGGTSPIYEHLFRILAQLLGEEETARFLAQLHIDFYLCVLDTNYLLSELKYRLLHGHATALFEAAGIGGLRLVASTQVRDEVPEHMGEVLAKYGLSREDGLEVWHREYVPRLTFVDPTEVPPLTPGVKQLVARDADDVPTAQLIELLQADVAFSRDKDLAAFGALAHETARVAVAYKVIAHRDANVLAIHMGGTFAVSVSATAIEAAASAFGSLVKRMDWRILACLLLLGGCACLAIWAIPSARRRVGDHAKAALSLARRGLAAYAQMEASADEARQTLVGVRRPCSVSRRTARDYAALVLGRASGPLTVRSIVERMQQAGYRPRSAKPQYYVAHVLRAHPRLFEQTADGKWRLRSHPPLNTVS